jgi:hypothetical protein
MTNHVSKKPMTENNSFFTREFRAEQTHSIESTHHEAELTHSQAEPMQQIKSNGVWPDQTRTAVAACGPIRLEQRRRRDKKNHIKLHARDERRRIKELYEDSR